MRKKYTNQRKENKLLEVSNHVNSRYKKRDLYTNIQENRSSTVITGCKCNTADF